MRTKPASRRATAALAVVATNLCACGADTDSTAEAGAEGTRFGGVNFAHIKPWVMLLGTSEQIDEAEVGWLADHFDVVAGQVGPGADWDTHGHGTARCAGRPIEYTWGQGDHEKIRAWGEANGEDYEQVFLHYQWDTSVPMMGPTYQARGWNPDDDQGQCGGVAGDWVNDLVANVDGSCSGLPSDPSRSAATGEEARVPVYPGVPDWRMPDPVSETFLRWATDSVLTCNGWEAPAHCRVDCIWEDNTLVLPAAIDAWALDQTFRYAGIAADVSHPNITDRVVAAAALLDRVSESLARPVFGLPNVGASFPLCERDQPYRQLFLDLLDEAYIQVWLQGVNTPGGPAFDRNYEGAIIDLLSVTVGTAERRFIEVPVEKPFDTDERKLLILALFHLVNSENTYVSFNVYPSADYPDDIRGAEHPERFTWFGAISFDVGGAIPNHWGLADYLGAVGSHQHFVLVEGADPSRPSDSYRVLAREFERALVLVKLRPKEDSLADASTATTHELGRPYRPLRADGSLGEPIDRVVLLNGSGVVLVPSSTP
jgi:hypothetical protein